MNAAQLIQRKHNLPCIPCSAPAFDVTHVNRIRDTLAIYDAEHAIDGLQWLICDVYDDTVRDSLDAMVYRLLRRYICDAELCDDATVAIVGILEEAI